jgi:hypothetical protein
MLFELLLIIECFVKDKAALLRHSDRHVVASLIQRENIERLKISNTDSVIVIGVTGIECGGK